MEAIAAAGIVAVLRASDASRFERVPKLLVEAGVACVKFTLTSRGAVRALRRFAAACPKRRSSRPAGSGGRKRALPRRWRT